VDEEEQEEEQERGKRSTRLQEVHRSGKKFAPIGVLTFVGVCFIDENA
jgi:hypothetical protein